jgi:hypothetical protein
MSTKIRTITTVAVGAALLVSAVVVAPRVIARFQPPATVDLSLAAAQLPAVLTSTNHTPDNSAATKTTIAMCRPDTVLVGGYGRIVNGDRPAPVPEASDHPSTNPEAPYVKLTAATPVALGHTYGYRVSAVEIGSFPGHWYLTAVAYCTARPSGYWYGSQTLSRAVRGSAVVSTTCPTGTLPLVVGGMLVTASLSDAASTTLIGVRPQMSLQNSSNLAAAGTTTPVSYSLTVAAACADPPSGYRIVAGHGASSTTMVGDIASMPCPLGTRAYSMDGLVSNSAAHLTGFGITDGARSAYATAAADRSIIRAPMLSATAVCAH